MSDAPLLELRGLSTHYVSARGTRVVRAVDEVSLTLAAGSTLGVVGESGSGKSTLALTILRLLPPAAKIVSGEILLEGLNLLAMSDGSQQYGVAGARRRVGVQDSSFQSPALHYRDFSVSCSA